MAEVHVRQQFTAGETVELHRRVGDWWNGASGDPVATETADDAGSVTFEGLEEAAQFWAVCGDKALRVTAKTFTAAAKAARDVPAAELARQSRPDPAREITEGARDTASAKPTRDSQPAGTAKAETATEPPKPAAEKKRAARKRPAAKRGSKTSGRKSAGKSK